jgi:hypothetical protein
MSKPSKSVLCRDEAQGSSNGFLQVLMNASACSPQKGLQVSSIGEKSGK